MSKNYNTKQIEGDHPAMYMYISPFAMNRSVLREFDGYPIFTDKDYVWFIIFDNGDVIAFASLKKFPDKVIFVNSYVVPEYRSQGLHTKLIDERMKWCAQNDVKTIEVDCMDSSLQQFLKLGFKEIKTYVKWHKLEKRL